MRWIVASLDQPAITEALQCSTDLRTIKTEGTSDLCCCRIDSMKYFVEHTRFA